MTSQGTQIGGLGADTLRGDSGNDVFSVSRGDTNVSSSLAGRDVITDWENGVVIGVYIAADKIDLIDGNLVVMTTANTSSQLTISASELVTAGATGTGESGLSDFVSKASLSTTANSFAAWNDSGTRHFLFISDGVSGLGANDVLIELAGLSANGNITLSSGDITRFQ